MSIITAKEAKGLADKYYSIETKLQPLFEKIREKAESGQYDIIVKSRIEWFHHSGDGICIIDLNKRDLEYLINNGYQISNINVFDVVDEYEDDEEKDDIENYKIDSKGNISGFLNISWDEA